MEEVNQLVYMCSGEKEAKVGPLELGRNKERKEGEGKAQVCFRESLSWERWGGKGVGMCLCDREGERARQREPEKQREQC